ncbi:MAG: hypothetical protein ACON4B_07400 [Flavobacteriaceae bacterium]
MDKLKAKPKAPKGRPKKYLNPEKAFEWFDEFAFEEAKKKHQQWEEEYKNCVDVTGTEYECLEDFEKELRSKYPELLKLDITQLYIIEGKNKVDVERAFNSLNSISKPSLDKDDYTVKIPASKANEYSWYLAIAEAFNNIRAAGNTNINVAQLPNITGNRIVLDVKTMKIVPNAYLFTQDFK